MKTSELITALVEQMKMHGDEDVLCVIPEFGDFSVEEVRHDPRCHQVDLIIKP